MMRRMQIGFILAGSSTLFLSSVSISNKRQEGKDAFGGLGQSRKTMIMGGDDEKAIRDRTRIIMSRSSNERSRGHIPSETSNFSLNDLEDLLIEVLIRLPNFKYAFQSRCVCKNWYNLISTPYFASRFITYHHCNQNPSALIINYLSKEDIYRLFPVSDEPMFKSSGFELNYLLRQKHRLFKVVAIYKDLILCKYDWSYERFRAYVCNQFTNQCVDLPWLQLDELLVTIEIGFVCEPYYFVDSRGECTLNSNYRFRVVLINEEVTNGNENRRFILWTYCSETQKWCSSVLQGSEYLSISDVVAYNGKLLWYNGSSIFAYDPFNPELSTFIDCPYIHSTAFLGNIDSYYYIVGVCQDILRMMQVVSWNSAKHLAIWELIDYATMEWSLVDNFYLDTMNLESLIINASKRTSLAQGIEGGCKSLNPLGFHPSDKDIVYLHFRDPVISVISYNMQTREFKMVGEVSCKGKFYWHGNVFHIELPLWPMPIPQLIRSLQC